ncbi:tripartite tricarboxylate transporter substrate binding protein [Roseateles sp. DAIF2]|uniref:Bug family tripartite tricarboxylate transporter substrate binding protein n=1 Tax=Roseateles sp. DAIF2 TaxID=2714952 RepID=UPI0018A2E3D4|nr:tripartite tricarboxylate transporter substrate binding protein [Roseateles sp. DAIF2]QPF71618.1 tripartite tricarboxylate transporter substrate binding protein [Roseateles sp. DAIF2]
MSSPALPRRSLLLLLPLSMLPLQQALAADAAWPVKPVRIVVPYAPGGTSDAVARLLGERLQAVLGQPVVIESRPGASGTTGMDQVAKAPADGHTLAFAAISPLTLNPHLQPRMPYDALKDIAPVAQVMYSPVYLMATQAFSGKSFADAIAQAKARPGALNLASSGMGSIGHLMLEQIGRKAGVRFNHIPYKGGGQVTNDALGGQFELFTANPAPALNAQIASGRLRVLAVAAPQRLATLPEVPTLAELGHPDANLGSTFGLFAPARTPREVQLKINAEFNKLLAAKEVQERLAKLDSFVATGSVEAFAARVRQEHEANARVVQEAGIKAD